MVKRRKKGYLKYEDESGDLVSYIHDENIISHILSFLNHIVVP